MSMTRNFFFKYLSTAWIGIAKAKSSLGKSDIVTSKYRYKFPGIEQTVRMICVSDIHMSPSNLKNGKLLTLINSLSPDIFVLAGDIVDRSGRETIVERFENISSSLFKVATLGNWEYQCNMDLKRLADFYLNAGVTLLVNKVIYSSGFALVGIDDWLKGQIDYDLIGRISVEGKPIIIVSHCPVVFNKMQYIIKNKFLVISGHTHGGQILPFGFNLYTPKGSGSFLSGWYHRGDGSMYVMRGIGTTPGIPIRIGAEPEILVLDLVG